MEPWSLLILQQVEVGGAVVEGAEVRGRFAGLLPSSAPAPLPAFVAPFTAPLSLLATAPFTSFPFPFPFAAVGASVALPLPFEAKMASMADRALCVCVFDMIPGRYDDPEVDG